MDKGLKPYLFPEGMSIKTTAREELTITWTMSKESAVRLKEQLEATRIIITVEPELVAALGMLASVLPSRKETIDDTKESRVKGLDFDILRDLFVDGNWEPCPDHPGRYRSRSTMGTSTD